MLPSAFVSEYLIQGGSGDSFFGIDGAVPDGTDAFSEADPATVKPSWVHAAKSLSTFEESDLHDETPKNRTICFAVVLLAALANKNRPRVRHHHCLR